jgi:copper chaperone CopZ
MLGFVQIPPYGIGAAMSANLQEIVYTVPGISCGHCRAAIADEVARVAGVAGVDVDVDAKRVAVRGHEVDDAAVRAAVTEAGYEVAS